MIIAPRIIQALKPPQFRWRWQFRGERMIMWNKKIKEVTWEEIYLFLVLWTCFNGRDARNPIQWTLQHHCMHSLPPSRQQIELHTHIYMGRVCRQSPNCHRERQKAKITLWFYRICPDKPANPATQSEFQRTCENAQNKRNNNKSLNLRQNTENHINTVNNWHSE